MRIAVDSGGTFTDCVYLKDGAIRVLKLFSTPHDPGKAVLDSVLQVAVDGATPEVRHGTTVGTNAISSARAPASPSSPPPALKTPSPSAARRAPASTTGSAPRAPASSPQSCASASRSAPAADRRHPPLAHRRIAHQTRRRHRRAAAPSPSPSRSSSPSQTPPTSSLVAAALRPLGLPISISHQILPEFREYERASTVVANAYLAPRVGTYLGATRAVPHRRLPRQPRPTSCSPRAASSPPASPQRARPHRALRPRRRRHRSLRDRPHRRLRQDHRLRHGRHLHRRLL